MNLTKVQQFILFTLGMSTDELNRRVAGKPLEITLSKAGFIELAMKSGIVGKKERALYKNLEMLEKKKLITYRIKAIHLTERGKKWFAESQTALQPYITAQDLLSTHNLIQYTRKARIELAVGNNG